MRHGYLVLKVVIAAWLALSLVLTASRAGLWRDEQRLWLEAHAQSPAKLRPLVNLGALAQDRGDLEQARLWYEQVVATAPARPLSERREGLLVARLNVILLEHRLGDADRARQQFTELLAEYPTFRARDEVRRRLWQP